MDIYPGLELVEADGRLTARVQLALERAPLEMQALRDSLTQAGCGDWYLHEDALATLLERYSLPDAQCELLLAERRDAVFRLEIAPDAMVAWGEIAPAYGGELLNPDDLTTALAEAGVTFGIAPAAITALCASTVPQRLALATGKPAVDGEHTRFELLVADTRDRAPQVDARGLINFRELGAIPLVVAGQPLMRRYPPTAGAAGCNVRGETVAPVPGRNDVFVENLPGSQVASDNPDLLVATVNGQPVRSGNGVKVEQILQIGDVDMASGNISFDGTVQVNGEVLPGMKIHATGDIIVKGVVDAAEIDAGGDIQVGGGIIAQARVNAGGSVHARFVENGHVRAGSTITIDDAALQSDLQAMNQIIVGAKSRERGRLAGGSARAQLLVQAPVVGATSGGVTTIQLGVNPVLDAKYQDVLHRLEKQKEEEGNLEKLLKHLTTHGDKGGMLERVQASWEHAVQAWGVLIEERDALERELALNASARLVVSVGVGGALDLTFGKKVMKVNTLFGSGAFLVDDEQIIFTTDQKA